MNNHDGGLDRNDVDDDSGADQSRHDEIQRETLADEREVRLDQREVRVHAWESAQTERMDQAQRILADAAERDDHADARDSLATTRDTAAGLQSFLNDSEAEFGSALTIRRSAAINRSESKADRAAAAVDRSHLVDGDLSPSDDAADPVTGSDGGDRGADGFVAEDPTTGDVE